MPPDAAAATGAAATSDASAQTPNPVTQADGGKPNPPSPGAAKFLEYGGKVFATQDELVAHIKTLEAGAANGTRAEEAERKWEAAKKAAAGDIDAYREFQKSIGTPDAVIEQRIAAAQKGTPSADDDDDDDDDAAAAAAAAGEPAGGGKRKISINEMDEKSIGYFTELGKAHNATVAMARKLNEQSIKGMLAEDPTVGKYWASMTDKQKKLVIEQVKQQPKVAKTLADKGILEDEVLESGRQAARGFVLDMLGDDPDILSPARKTGGDVPTSLGGSPNVSVATGMTDEELNAVDWSKPVGTDEKNRDLLDTMFRKTFEKQRRQERAGASRRAN